MFEIIGFENLSFTNPDSGELISGTKFYLIGDDIIKNGSGKFCISKFIPSSKINGNVKVGGLLDFQYSLSPKGEARIVGVTCS